MNKKREKMSFKDYYLSLKSSLREEICSKLEISEKTFYNKMNDNSFDHPQKVVISQITGRPIEELFPSSKSPAA